MWSVREFQSAGHVVLHPWLKDRNQPALCLHQDIDGHFRGDLPDEARGAIILRSAAGEEIWARAPLRNR